MYGFIEAAVKLYSGDRPLDLFVQKLPANVKSMDTRYLEILDVFTDNGESDLMQLRNRWRPDASSPRSS